MNLPQPFVDAATSNHEYKPNRYSVTELLGGTCEAILKRRHQGEAEEDVADRVWAILGSAVHKVLQEAKASDTQTQEKWVSVRLPWKEVCEFELSGIYDLFDEAIGTVTDYKSCSVWKTQVGDFEDWRLQTLMYCWILRQLGFNARRGEVVAIMRDHNKRKATYDSDYPQHPVLKLDWEFDTTDFKKIEEHIKQWFLEVKEQISKDDYELIECKPDNRWHKPDKWAVIRDGKSSASRVFESEDEANDLCAKYMLKKKVPYHVEHRQGEDTKCIGYCSVSQFCPHWNKINQNSHDNEE